MQHKPIRLLVFGLIMLALGSVLLVSCVRPGSEPGATAGGAATPGGAASNGGNTGGGGGGPATTVDMAASNFAQPTVTISKGGSIKLANSSPVPHIIANGMWDNGIAKAGQEAGAPAVQQVMFQPNDSKTFGPFNTAGTFHLYCTIHPGMNLTVTVNEGTAGATPTAAATQSSTGGGQATTVNMSDATFAQPTITINKGDSIKFANSSPVPHIIANGMWDNGAPKPNQEAGAPVVSQVMFQPNDSKTYGPFNTAGTYHFYCSIHPGMNLTVTVK